MISERGIERAMEAEDGAGGKEVVGGCCHVRDVSSWRTEKEDVAYWGNKRLETDGGWR